MKILRINIIAVVMALISLALISILISYHTRVVSMRKEQFDTEVTRTLNRVARELEREETVKALKEDLHDAGSDNIGDKLRVPHADSIELINNEDDAKNNTTTSSSLISHETTESSGLTLTGKRTRPTNDFTDKMRADLKDRYVYQRDKLDTVISRILYSTSKIPLEERINFSNLDSRIRKELKRNGVDIPYHFTVTNRDGRLLYKCADYTDEGADHCYTAVLMPNNEPSNRGILTVSFPSINRYIYKSTKYIAVALIFILILGIVFIHTIRMTLRQHKLSEMKNDFVNNMTHELKTPVASISLASQMLTDKSIKKSEQMTEHLSGVISNETKRLQRLIEKVLQTSLLEGKRLALREDVLNINTMTEDVANTFAIKVEEKGGKITTDLQATKDRIIGDEVHITNVLFNLMENAVKYSNPDKSPELSIKTYNKHNNICITFTDNGIGIKKEDLKKIFEKFYRVHSGNKHDVKGFGLGLAYVRNIVELHHGHIHAESELGKGTKFIITLPTIKD